jgi:hypothetical protein
MTTLRNEILKVKELKKMFVSEDHQLLQISTPSKNTIQKTLVEKLGFSKVIGMKLVDVKNDRFDSTKVGYVNPISGMKYMETEYRTETSWILE